MEEKIIPFSSSLGWPIMVGPQFTLLHKCQIHSNTFSHDSINYCGISGVYYSRKQVVRNCNNATGQCLLTAHISSVLADCYLDLTFDPEDGTKIFFRNVGKLFGYMISHREEKLYLLEYNVVQSTDVSEKRSSCHLFSHWSIVWHILRP